MLTYPEEVLADEPAGYWRLDEASGPAANMVSGGASLTHINTPTVGVAGHVVETARAVSYNRAEAESSECSTPTSMRKATGITLELWVNIPTLPTHGAFIKVGDDATGGTQNGWGLGVGDTNFDTSGSKLIGLYERVRWIPTTHVLTTGWQHVAMTVDGAGTAEFFVNGASVGSSTGTAPHAATGQVKVGGYTTTDPFDRHSTAIIDEVAVYPSILTAVRLKAHHDAALRTTWAAYGWSTAKSPIRY